MIFSKPGNSYKLHMNNKTYFYGTQIRIQGIHQTRKCN